MQNQTFKPIITAVPEITKGFDFVGKLEDNQSALLTNSVEYSEDDHLFALRDDEEVIVGEVGGQSVQFCQDHWRRTGKLMGWL